MTTHSMMKSLLFFSLTVFALMTFGCAHTKGDRCYLDIIRYNEKKELFINTGSMQRVEQSMELEKWAECEREQLRYQLTKDLQLDAIAFAAEPVTP
ncbi:MAG: hypothetical protein ACFCU1_08070 [Sumerlaeia bacterium]